MSDTLNDMEGLVRRFTEGDDRAFAQLFNHFHRDLLYFSYNLTNHLQESEEIVSNTFAKLWKLRDRFDSAAGLKAFLYVTCRNECYDFLRFKSSSKGRLETNVEDWNNLGPDEQPDRPLQFEMIYMEVLNHLYKEIDELSPRLRQVTNKYFIDGLTTREIANELGLSEQTIRNAKTLAIKQLQTDSLLKKLLEGVLAFVFYFLL